MCIKCLYTVMYDGNVGVSQKRSFNVHKDKGVFLNDKMFDKKDFVI